MERDLLRRARSLLDPGPDPYRHLDRAAATRLCAAVFLVGFACAAIALPLTPPSGPLGVVGVVTCLAVTTAVGVVLLRRDEPAAPGALLAASVGAVAAATVMRAAAGPDTPFDQLLLIVAFYTGAVHPARRTVAVLALATAGSLSPAVYEPAGRGFAAASLSRIAMMWGVGLLVMVWQTRVRRMRAEAESARRHAEDLARVDPLTGLSNRRALEEALPVAVAGARRSGRPFSVLVADLDDFKEINDAHGHQAGDDVLRGVSRSLTAALRLSDPSFRYGGDEFVALLPDADIATARDIATRVQRTVGLACRTPAGRPVRLTVGIAELRHGETGADLFARADCELLSSKAARRRARSRAT